MKIALLGDSFIDEYIFGEIERVSPEAPVPVLDVKHKERRGGGAINVANNLFGLGVDFTLFTITSMKLPYKVITPKSCTALKKTRYVGSRGSMKQQIMRVDEPKEYLKQDLKKMVYPSFSDFDIIAFIDYNKGTIKEGKATIVDSKKKDLSVFKGTEYLKINLGEWKNSTSGDNFPKIFVTKGEKGIDYFEYGQLKFSEPTLSQEIVDISGAGDTVMATMIYCLVHNITDPRKMMQLANKAAGIVIGKFGTASATFKELNL